MRAATLALSFALATIPLAAIAQTPAPKANLAAAIGAANAKWIAAFNAGDAAGMAQLYTETATLLPAGAPVVVGRPGIATFWQGAMKSSLKNPMLQTVSVESYGRAAREIGRVTLEAPGPNGTTAHVEGKYVVVWKRARGGWQLDSDIWNLDK